MSTMRCKARSTFVEPSNPIVAGSQVNLLKLNRIIFQGRAHVTAIIKNLIEVGIVPIDAGWLD